MLAVYLVFEDRNDQQYITQLEQCGALVGYANENPRAVEMGLKLLPWNIRKEIPYKKGPVIAVAFFGPKPTDGDVMVPLSHLPSLQQIRLSHTSVTDGVLKPICGQKSLRLLWLESTQISDIGVSTLSTNRSVTHLFLDNTKVTDEAIAHLSMMTQLHSLSLSGTAITDASVDHFLALPRLRVLDVSGTRISRAGIDRLRAKGTIEICSGLAKR